MCVLWIFLDNLEKTPDAKHVCQCLPQWLGGGRMEEPDSWACSEWTLCWILAASIAVSKACDGGQEKEVCLPEKALFSVYFHLSNWKWRESKGKLPSTSESPLWVRIPGCWQEAGILAFLGKPGAWGQLEGRSWPEAHLIGALIPKGL